MRYTNAKGLTIMEMPRKADTVDEEQLQRIWRSFDDAFRTAVTPDGRAVVMAARALAELIDGRLADLQRQASKAGSPDS